MPEITCRSCPHYLPTQVGQGECHAEPPRPAPIMAPNPITKALEVSGVLGLFPPVRADVTWCSRHPEAWKIPAARVAEGMASAEKSPTEPSPDDVPPNGAGPRLVV